MKRKLSKRLTTLLIVIALLLLILPAGILFADSISGGGSSPKHANKNQPEETEIGETEETEDIDAEEEEEEEEEGEPSEQAEIVAERIAKAIELGIPPGHLNLIDKLAAISDISRADLLPLWQGAPAGDIMKEIKRLRFEAKGKEMPGPDAEEEITEETGDADEQDSDDGTEGNPGKTNNGQGKGKGQGKK